MASSTPEFKATMVEKLTLGVAKSLNKRQGVCDVMVDHKGPADAYAITKWEAGNCCTLPSDLKEFYLTTDGFLLFWKVKIKDETIPVGRMEINSISKLEKLCGITVDSQTGKPTPSVADLDLTQDEDPDGLYPHFDIRSRIFELDPCSSLGKVCLVYNNTKQGIPAREASYWFLDKALRWHFITDNFQSYFRLMITNLGLPQWQYLFTDMDISPSVQQWYHLYAPCSTDLLTDNSLALQNMSGQTVSNQLDINRVFKGKEKKKLTAQPTSNQAANQRRKVGSPLPNRNAGLRSGVSNSTSANRATSTFR